MPRKLLIRDSLFPYHITNRTLEKRMYPLPMSRMWSMYVDQLRIAAWAYGANIHAFVLMGNHYHLLMSTPDLNVDEIIQNLQSQISIQLLNELGSKDWSFSTRYRWSLVREKNYFYNVYRYIYQNPIRANITKRVSGYPYSTFHGRAGYSKLEIPISHHCFYEDLDLSSIEEEEKWLNQLISEDQLALIRKGIRRFEFKIPVKGNKGLASCLPKR